MASGSSVLFLLGAWALYAELGAGGGVDSNVNRGVHEDEHVVAGYAELSALAGAALPFEEQGRDELWVELGWDWSVLPAFADLTSHRGALSTGLAWDLVPRLSLRTSATGAALAYGDSARDGFSASGGAGLRWRARDWLVPGLRLDYTLRTARDEVFGFQALRAGMQVGLLPSEDVDIALGYSLTATDVVSYEPATASPTSMQPGRRRAAPVSTFGGEQLAERRPALVHALDATGSVDLTEALYVSASYGLELVRLDEATAVAHLGGLRLAVHWD